METSIRSCTPHCTPRLPWPRLAERPELAPTTGAARASEMHARANVSRTEAAVDYALVGRFNAGDETAFDEIVARHRPKIQALAQGFLHNYADAEEIAQDTFVRAYRGLAQFRGDASLATWLHRIAVNLARNRYWYFFRRRRHLTASFDCPLGENSNTTFGDLLASPEGGPTRQAAMTEFAGLVTLCMDRLEAGHREILTLRNELHRSYAEISHALGITDGTVKSRIARARGKLRALIVEACPEFPADAPVADWLEPAGEGAAV